MQKEGLPIKSYAVEISLKNLSHRVIMLYRQGRYAEAIEIAEKALDLATRTYGSDHPYTLKARENLLLLYKAKAQKQQTSNSKQIAGKKTVIFSRNKAFLRILPLIFLISLVIFISDLISGTIQTPESGALVPVPQNEEFLPFYNVQADFYPERRVIEGKEEVVFEHFDPQREVVFNLYLNSYNDSRLDSAETRKYAALRGREPGYINIQNVYYRGKPVVHRKDGQVLRVSLDEEDFSPGRQSLEISFRVRIPLGADRVGGNNDGIWLGNWLPTLSVDGNEYVPTDVGDPYVNFSSTYQIDFSVPRNYDLVLSNTNLVQNTGDRKIYHGRLERVRDLPVFLHKGFHRETVKSEEVEINYYYYSASARSGEVLNSAREAMKFYSDYVGEYPWKQLNIVENDMYLSGMEYSTLILVSGRAVNMNPDGIIFHEVGHQWFYNIVGNDQYNAPFMDEGLVEFICSNVVVDQKARFRVDLTGLDRNLGQFDSWKQYRQIHYHKGQQWFESLYFILGRDGFRDFIRQYYDEFKYDIVSPTEFKDFIHDYTDNPAVRQLTGILDS